MNDAATMRWLVIVSLLSFVIASGARTGTVRTLTGELFTGHIAVTPERIVIANARQNLLVGISITNVARLTFDPDERERRDTTRRETPPDGWKEMDLGAQRVRGSTRYENGTWAVRGSGSGMEAERDSCHYVCKPVRGDSEIVARVVSVQYTDPRAKAGVMMRENLGEYSRNVMVAVTAMRGGTFQLRPTEGQNTEILSQRDMSAPHWVKLRRRANEFTGYKSRNGREWTLIEKTSLPMSTNFYVGLAVASARDGLLNWSTFDKVREARKLVNEDFTPQIELVSGSIIVGRPEAMDQTRIDFAGGPRTFAVPTPRVARIAYQPLPADMEWRARAGRPGVWISGGDFIDGEFPRIEGDGLRLSSVLYGLRTFDVNDEVLAVVLRPRRSSEARFEVQTLDGSILLASELILGQGQIKLKEAVLGEVRVPSFEVAEIRRR